MNIKQSLKKYRFILYMYVVMKKIYFNMLTLISPELNTRIRYKQVFHKELDLNNPKTLNEKICWLKLKCYAKDPLVIQCADKYRVREYVEKSGCGDILNKLYEVYDSVDDIIWENLPNQFVLKWNFGAGYNIICTDKSKVDKHQTIQTLKKWGKSKCWLDYSEMQYKYIPKKIICERLLNVSTIGE